MTAPSLRIPKESLIKLHTLQNQELVIRFLGGREVCGKLKSWDKSMNLVMDQCIETRTGQPSNAPSHRQFGLIVIKGSQVQTIALKDGFQLIENPYANQIEGQSQQQSSDEEEEEEKEKEEESQKDSEQKEQKPINTNQQRV